MTSIWLPAIIDDSCDLRRTLHFHWYYALGRWLAADDSGYLNTVDRTATNG